MDVIKTMKRHLSVILIFLPIIFLWSCTMSRTEVADLVLYNGVIFTSQDDISIIQALAVKGGKILDVGSDDQMARYISSGTKIIDLQGRFACPGFNDAHLHFMGGGIYAKRLNFQEYRSPEEVAALVKKKAQEAREGEWILGRGWDQTVFPGKKWPTKELLDQAAPDYPVFLRRVDGHIAWANSRALRIAGITRETKNPEGGEILKDPRTGEPTGILKETAADLVYDLIPKPSKAQIREAVEYSLDEAKRYGVTSIQDNSVPEVLEVYEELEKEGRLTVRVSEWLDFQDDLTLYKALKEKYSSPEGLIRFFTLKGYVDGTLGSRTAAMLEPYSDDPSTSGLLQMEDDKLKERVRKGHEAGFTIALHAIGDRAVRAALDSFEALSREARIGRDGSKRGRSRAVRNRVEHAQVIASDDLPRFSQLGVIASMQPVHCGSDMKWAEERIGQARSKGAYAWKSILSSGARICFGTDWPVESMNPMLGLSSAVTRMSPDELDESKDENRIQGGWIPQERISIREALKCYTSGSAYAEYAENYKGTLKKGKCADIVVLSKNLLEIEPRQIPTTEVVMTIFNGRIIYEKK